VPLDEKVSLERERERRV